jgi:hypothetical protein
MIAHRLDSQRLSDLQLIVGLSKFDLGTVSKCNDAMQVIVSYLEPLKDQSNRHPCFLNYVVRNER